MNVEERWRSRGVGTWLLRHGVAWLRLARCDRIALAVGADDEARGAGRFYRRFGWDALVRKTRSWTRNHA
jgi:GNAT superfamily N-acetyltransferase